MSNFDPYEILGLPPGSTQAEIKRSYRKQSLILHPDKETGDEKAFMRLTKAYQVSEQSCLCYELVFESFSWSMWYLQDFNHINPLVTDLMQLKFGSTGIKCYKSKKLPTYAKDF